MHLTGAWRVAFTFQQSQIDLKPRLPKYPNSIAIIHCINFDPVQTSKQRVVRCRRAAIVQDTSVNPMKTWDEHVLPPSRASMPTLLRPPNPPLFLKPLRSRPGKRLLQSIRLPCSYIC